MSAYYLDCYYGIPFDDWGENRISNGGGYNWFTLEASEWNYLIDKRLTSSGIRFAKAKVNDIQGLILLPDNWNANNYLLKETNNKSAEFDSNIISVKDWDSEFAANGAVFLPAAGERRIDRVVGVGQEGCYWTATPSLSLFVFICSGTSNSITLSDGSKLWNCGNSVRLVRSAK